MKRTIMAAMACAAFVLPMGPAAMNAWAQPTINAQVKRTHVFAEALLLDHTCVAAQADSIVAASSSGPLFSHQAGHLCTLDNCTKDDLKTGGICQNEGAVDLSCTVMTFAADCSQITLVCVDQANHQTFHTLGQGRANPTNPPPSGFVDGVALLAGLVNIVHADSANPALDCGSRIGPTP